MVVLPVTTLDDIAFDHAVSLSIYNSLNDVVREICGKTLPMAFMLYFEGLLNHNTLRAWLKKNEEMYK